MLKDPTPLIWDDRLNEADKIVVLEVNEALERLGYSRAIEINPTGPFGKSKLAWKLARYSQALQHRVVGLADAVAICWNGKNVLGSFLAARAIIETAAVVHMLTVTTRNLLTAGDLNTLNDFLDNATFATRDEILIASNPSVKARGILSAIDRLDRALPGVRGHYDRMSERCHPNASGHTWMFSRLDTAAGTTTFHDEVNIGSNSASIVAGYLLCGIAEKDFEAITELTSELAELQSRLHPIKNA
ncbi:Hypothetical protein NGAL_HAMBI2605_09610 [Neorhizobium galegae bv. orientalis]|nr:Hypothetical protein NGAL_HAMBI2605_09610 [Neorhizobium galegae bv. orientalis]